jgi:signal transduction histidine kinase
LAVAVVVAGGAVARVASVNSRTEQQSRLARQVVDVANFIVEREAFLGGRAGDSSPAVTIALRDGRKATSNLRAQDTEWVTVIAAETGLSLGTLRGDGSPTPPTPEQLGALSAVKDAGAGQPASDTTLSSSGVLIIGAAPVYRAGSEQAPSDVLAVVVVGTARTVDDLRAVVGDDDVGLVVRDSDRAASSMDVDVSDLDVDIATQTIETEDGQWFAAGTRLPESRVDVVLLAPTSSVVGPALDLVRAFLLAILAAALLAVVAALWLSSRITRPLLDLAVEAERVKTDFLASVSHELRTPLTPIRGYTEILKMTGTEGEASEYLDEIGIATQRLERIVALLVDVAAIEAGRYLIDPQESSLTEMFAEAASRWAGRSRRHQLECKIAKTLPSVRADAHAIGRVLDELIDNAIKFSPDGGEVELRAKRIGASVEVSVSDQGTGMDEEALAQATSAFATKESGDARRFGGLGLGLAFVEGVLHQHGARLDISSKLGEGTTCRFSLPVAGSVTRMERKAPPRGA